MQGRLGYLTSNQSQSGVGRPLQTLPAYLTIISSVLPLLKLRSSIHFLQLPL